MIVVAALAVAVFAFPGIAGGKKSKKGKAGPLVVSTKSFDLSQIDSVRYEVYCPRGKRPFGGGIVATPPVTREGAGVFPDSSERLGAQQGWHITATLTEPASKHEVKLQAFCRTFKGNVQLVGKELANDVRPGDTTTATATCPGKGKIVSGGFLTTGFRGGKGTFPGMYISQSRMSSPNSWTVTAVGEPGGTGGQFNPIAYCYKSKKPLLREQASAPVTVEPGQTATAVAPSCGRGKHALNVGGYKGDTGLHFFDTYLNPAGAWSASAIPFANTGGSFTAYAYCWTGK